MWIPADTEVAAAKLAYAQGFRSPEMNMGSPLGLYGWASLAYLAQGPVAQAA